MAKIDIVSGFLGAGKTTLIKKLLAEAYQDEKLVLIENEFGEISVDGGFLKETGVEISEMSSGCICCSLVGDFGEALAEVEEQFHPDRILIEPSGVGKLSDVVVAVQNAAAENPALRLNSFVTVADASKVKIYMKNFGEFYNNQVESAGTIILSRTQNLTQEKLEAAVELLRGKNPGAAIITTPWDQLDGKTVLAAIEKTSLEEELLAHIRAEHEAEEAEHEHHHHHHGHDEEHEHHHHHDHDEDEHEHHHHDHDEGHEHHHHDHDDEHEHEHHHHDHDGEHEHHHHDHDDHEHEHHHHDHDGEHEHHHHDHDEDHEHHDHGPDCGCGCHDHDHDHHGHHHADEVFASWGKETVKPFSREELERILSELDLGECGAILRAKGIVPAGDGTWNHFDYVPEEWSVRTGPADYTGRLCVIGAELKEEKLAALFGL